MSAHDPIDIVEIMLPGRHFYTLTLGVESPLSTIATPFFQRYPKGVLLSDSLTKRSKGAFTLAPLFYARQLLGVTIDALLLDLRQSFPLDFVLSAINTLRAGGVLILVRPSKIGVDRDGGRFSLEPFITPHFNHLLQESLVRFSTKVSTLSDLWSDLDQKGRVISPTIGERPSQEQQSIIDHFLRAKRGIYTLFAPRGRGKSWIGRVIIAQAEEEVILTAANQQAIIQYRKAPLELNFRAVDDLLLNESCETLKGKSLIIEEAAKVPLAHLEQLAKRFGKVLLISSLDGYEGTGQGLRQKLGSLLTITKAYQLNRGMRFNEGDAVAQWGRYLTLQWGENQNKEMRGMEQLSIGHYEGATLPDLQQDYQKLKALYNLLLTTHYQTNVQDIRRLLDNQEQSITIATEGERVVGLLWALREGGQSKELAWALFRGLRRPKGNLVPQTLSAHGYFLEAMLLKSIRISRISVDEYLRRRGIAGRLIKKLEQAALRMGVDYLSVSFGLTKELLTFWRYYGFVWVHIGTHRDKSTGLHAAVMIKPLTEAGEQLVKRMEKKWHADVYHLKEAPFLRPESRALLPEGVLGSFDYWDQRMLAAARTYRKPKSALYCALRREELVVDKD